MIASFSSTNKVVEAPNILEVPEDQLLPNQRADLEAHRAALARIDMMPSPNSFIEKPMKPLTKPCNTLQCEAREQKAREIYRTPYEDPYDPDSYAERMLHKFGKTR